MFSEDEVLALMAICTRLAVLSGCRDLSGWVDENEGGKQSSAWDILMSLSERGRMGHKEEETVSAGTYMRQVEYLKCLADD